MALTIKTKFKTKVADRYLIFGTLDFDSSYPTGGEALSDANLGLNDDNLDVLVFSKSGYLFEYDHTNQKVLVYYGDNDNASDGPMVEQSNGGNLSTLTGVQFIAFGKRLA